MEGRRIDNGGRRVIKKKKKRKKAETANKDENRGKCKRGNIKQKWKREKPT